MRNGVLVALVAAVALAVVGTSLAGGGSSRSSVQIILAGKVKLPPVPAGSPAQAATASVHVTFSKAFHSTPVVVATQEVPSLDPYADSFVSTYRITPTGFDFQRRNTKAEVWNEAVTVDWVAVGT